MTKSTTLILASLALGLSACGSSVADMCNSSLLYAGMTPEQQANCDECDNYLGCDNELGDGDGDTDPADLVLACDGGIQYQGAFDRHICVEWPAGVAAPTGLDYTWASSQCPSLSRPVDCGERDCYLCRAGDMGGMELAQAASNDGWGLCGVKDGFAPTEDYIVARRFEIGEPLPPYMSDDWIDDLICPTGTWVAGSCPKGMLMQDTSADGFLLGSATCKCETDLDCQAGAVCEGGYVMDGYTIKPTLCTWDDGSGTSNGNLPDGPGAYGLRQWSDGILWDAPDLTVSTQALLSLGVLEDDQEFAVDGTLTHCGPDALCSLLGMSVGEQVLAGPQEVANLIEYGFVAIDILDPVTNTTRTIRVTVDDTAFGH